METMGRPYQVQVAQLQAENAQLKAELAQCHADKDEMVKRNKLLRDRPDLPLERLAAYDKDLISRSIHEGGVDLEAMAMDTKQALEEAGT